MIPIAPKRPVGRPPTVIDYQMVGELAKLGLTTDTIADRLGIDRKTLWNHMGKVPELRAAYNAGVADLVTLAASKLRGLVEQSDLGAIALVLRTRGNFVTPKQEVSVTVTNQAGPLIDGHVSDIALEHSRLLDGPNPDDIIDIEIIE